MSTLYVVATPIGNKEDFTDRARSILESVDYIFAEDTRMVKQLLGLYQIKPKGKTISYHAKSSNTKEDSLITILKDENITCALVTDAGTPAISDPGSSFVSKIRDTLLECKIIPVPGASAITALVSVSGLPDHRFSFWGFVPQKKGRKTFLENLCKANIPVVFYESPHRIIKTLEALSQIAPNKNMVVGREMTKYFEEYPRKKVSEMHKYYLENKDKIKGEFTCIIY